jgi:hypothetical protein
VENGQNLLVIANCHDVPVQVNLSGILKSAAPATLYSCNADWKADGNTLTVELQSYGFLLIEY